MRSLRATAPENLERLEGAELARLARQAKPSASSCSATTVASFGWRAIDELPDGFRAVFVMRDIEAMSVAETADVLALSPATVKKRLYRAAARTPGAGCPAGLGIARHFPLRRRSLSTNDGNGAGQPRPATRPGRLRPTAGGEHDRRRTTNGKGSMRCSAFAPAPQAHPDFMPRGSLCQAIVAQAGAAPGSLTFAAPHKSDIFMPQSLSTGMGRQLESRRANRPIPCLGLRRGEGSCDGGRQCARAASMPQG